jgi:hypothetical protein
MGFTPRADRAVRLQFNLLSIGSSNVPSSMIGHYPADVVAISR